MRQLSILLFSSLLLLGACKWKTTKTSLKQGDALKSSLEAFEKNREKLSEEVVESLEEAGEALAVENPDLPDVSKDFEKQWTSIQNRYEKLKKDFDDVGETSSDYFNKLNELSSSIQNEDLRKEELAKNKALRQRWDRTYNEASVNVAKVTNVLEEGNDFQMVLVASSIRQKLEQNVDDLNRIAAQAKALLAELETFTEEGRKLVAG
ncbi:MAG: hypothetical protein AAGI23_00530 [Bacteroidota bacterium]